MFEGSEHQPRGYFEPLQEAGASLNGSTSADRTNYWEVVPKEAARARAVDGSGSHGLAAAGADRRALRDAARRRAQRAAAELREPAVRPRAVCAARRDLSGRPSVSLADDRRPRRSPRGDGRRRARVLLALLPSGQRVARASRGDIDAGAALDLATSCFGEIPAGPPVAPRRRHRARGPAASARARGPRRAAAPLSRLAVAGALRARRRGAGSRRGSARQRPDVASVRAAHPRARASRRSLRRARDRASSAATSRSSRRAAPGHTLDGARARRSLASCRRFSTRRADRRRARARAARRPRRRSSIGCRRSAVLAARPISSTPTTSIAGSRTRSTTTCGGIWSRRRRRFARPCGRGSIRRRPWRSASCLAGSADLALPGSDAGAPDVTADRFVLPDVGAPGPVRFPPIARDVLDNGLRVWSMAHTTVPVGHRAARHSLRRVAPIPRTQPGLAGVAADLLDEARRPVRRDSARRRLRAPRHAARSPKSGPTSSRSASRRSIAFFPQALALAGRRDAAPASRRVRPRARARASVEPVATAEQLGVGSGGPRVLPRGLRRPSLRSRRARHVAVARGHHARRRARVSYAATFVPARRDARSSPAISTRQPS